MGYSTYFDGQFVLNKKLDSETYQFLVKLSETRRMARNLPEEYGVEGEFYVDGGGWAGQDNENNVIHYNDPPKTQPGLWCKWCPTEDGLGIEWNGREKFYNYVEWLQYLIEKVLKPRGYILRGDVYWQGETCYDAGCISVENNIVTARQYKDCDACRYRLEGLLGKCHRWGPEEED